MNNKNTLAGLASCGGSATSGTPMGKIWHHNMTLAMQDQYNSMHTNKQDVEDFHNSFLEIQMTKLDKEIVALLKEHRQWPVDPEFI